MVTFKIPPFASFFPLSRINNFIGTKSATVSKSGNHVFPDMETVEMATGQRTRRRAVVGAPHAQRGN